MGRLAAIYRACDALLHPYRGEGFCLPVLEARACGLPVAALPVEGPVDVITDPAVGVLDTDLQAACRQALKLDRADCRAFVERRSWRESTAQFETYLAPRTRATASAQPASRLLR